MSYEITITEPVVKQVCYLEVDANVRYWEDATVNGVQDSDGKLIPCRSGNSWQPVIDLKTGNIQDWPKGITAKIHYKVCDAGVYYMLDESKKRVAKWGGHYVPDHFLSVGENGYGDYIILTVEEDGHIKNWPIPSFNDEDWEPVA